MMERAKRKLDRHPSATRQILDIIYAGRVKEHRDERLNYNSEKRNNAIPAKCPQLVMTSATLRNHLKLYLYNESGWLKKDALKKVVGVDARRRSPNPIVEIDSDGTPIKAFQHCVLTVSDDGDIRNILGAKPTPETGSGEGEAITPEALFSSEPEAPTVDESLVESEFTFFVEWFPPTNEAHRIRFHPITIQPQYVRSHSHVLCP